jgi:short-subunit dehydrogenase
MNIVISGGSRGIGKAIARKFYAAGHSVIIAARNAAKLKETANEIAAIPSEGKILTFACDLSQAEEIGRFADFVFGTFDKIDILVNNTGSFLPGAIHSEAEGILENQLQTNLLSAYHLTRKIVPAMIRQKSGQIFTLCSVASIKEYPNGGAYSISKFALLGFTKNLREELKDKNIKVCAVLPGATFTDSWAASGLPEERFVKPEDIADMVYAVSQLSPNAVVEEIIIRPQLGDI